MRYQAAKLRLLAIAATNRLLQHLVFRQASGCQLRTTTRQAIAYSYPQSLVLQHSMQYIYDYSYMQHCTRLSTTVDRQTLNHKRNNVSRVPVHIIANTVLFPSPTLAFMVLQKPQQRQKQKLARLLQQQCIGLIQLPVVKRLLAPPPTMHPFFYSAMTQLL